MDEEEKDLPKPQTDLPLPEKELPRPETNLPEPEKEITEKSTSPSQGEALEAASKAQTTENPRPQMLEQSDGGQAKTNLPIPKILVAGIVILITILAFGLIAYLMMGQNKAQAITSFEECVAAGNPVMESYPEQCAANGVTFTRELTNEEQANLDPTADWDTYIGDGYSFKYPPNWGYEQCPENFPENFLCSEQVSDDNTPSATFSYTITSGNDSPPESAQGIGVINYTEETINGLQVLRTDEIPGSSGSDSVYFKNGDSYTYLSISPYNKSNPYPSQKDMQDQFNQILSTFKFTNQNSELLTGEFIKRNYSPAKKIKDSDKYPSYPTELTSISDAQSVSFRCTDVFIGSSDRNGSYYTYNSTDGRKNLSDEEIITIAKNFANNLDTPSFDSFFVCETENLTKYIVGLIGGGGGGSENVVNVSQVLSPSSFSSISVINTDGSPYFGCGKLLQLTDQNAYLECGGGDAGFSSISIYKIGLSDHAANPILACASIADLDKEPEISCK